jgi:hypothetical protein
VERLRDRAARFAMAAGRTYQARDRIDDVVAAIGQAPLKPALVSALVWLAVGPRDEELGSHLIQVIRDRAGLPRITSPVRSADVAAAGEKLSSLMAWFCDRQVADTCARIEAVPVPFGPDDSSTLSSQMAAIARARETTPRVTPTIVAGFARRAAAFLVELSARKLDPLGFALSREVQLEADPPIARRVEIAAWARRAGHLISPPGTMVVLGIAIQAPWSWRLEVVAAEPGHGASGCVALLLRLVSEQRPPPPMARVPALLLVPDEPDDERGARFERWLAIAYPQATSEWRAWM